jgi:hypothetical protein
VSVLLVQLAAALALTIVIELAVVGLLGGRSVRELAAIALVNVITNLPLNLALTMLRAWVLPALATDTAHVVEWAFIGVAEAAVVVIEWRLLTWALRADSRTWLLRSVAMNAASFVLGGWLLVLAQQALVR